MATPVEPRSQLREQSPAPTGAALSRRLPGRHVYEAIGLRRTVTQMDTAFLQHDTQPAAAALDRHFVRPRPNGASR